MSSFVVLACALKDTLFTGGMQGNLPPLFFRVYSDPRSALPAPSTSADIRVFIHSLYLRQSILTWAALPFPGRQPSMTLWRKKVWISMTLTCVTPCVMCLCERGEKREMWSRWKWTLCARSVLLQPAPSHTVHPENPSMWKGGAACAFSVGLISQTVPVVPVRLMGKVVETSLHLVYPPKWKRSRFVSVTKWASQTSTEFGTHVKTSVPFPVVTPTKTDCLIKWGPRLIPLTNSWLDRQRK